MATKESIPKIGRRLKRRHILHIVPGIGPGGMELTMARVISGLTGDGMRHSIACLKGGAGELLSRVIQMGSK